MGYKRALYWHSYKKGQLAVAIPPNILPEDIAIATPTKMMVPRILEKATYVYGGRGPTSEEGVKEAIEAAKKRRYRVGIWVPTRWAKEYGYPIDLRLIEIYNPIENRWIKIKEEPLLYLVTFVKDIWRAEIPTSIVRKYNIYAFPTRHPLYDKYAMKVRVRWTAYTMELKPKKELKIYHFGNIYDASWDKINRRWRWIIPKDIAEDEGLLIAMNKGSIPDAEMHYNDDKEYLEIDFIIDPFMDKEVAKELGYARRNMVVRSYVIREEFVTDKTPEDFLVEIRATFITTPPREFYQKKGKHMRLVVDPHIEGDILAALNITCYNILRYFAMQIAEVKGHLYNPILSEKFQSKMEESIGVEINEKVSFGEVAHDRFGYVNKYFRVYHRRKGDWVKTTDYIDKKIKRMGGIVDSQGFVWSR